MSLSPSEKTAPSRAKVHSRRRTWLIAAGSVLAALLLAYGIGRLQGAAQLDEVEAKAERALETEQQASSKLQAELEAERSRASRLESRRRLHLALLALDERNFGTAQAQLAGAARLLEKSRLETGSDLDKLKAQLAGYKLVAGEDVGQQRDYLLGLTRRFDQLVTPAE